MSRKSFFGWTFLILANVLAWCVLGLYGTTGAAAGGNAQPFSNAVEQRHEMIRELQEIKALLKEQNTLLRAAAAQDTPRDRSQR